MSETAAIEATVKEELRVVDQPLPFADHKEITAADCEAVAKMLTDLAAQVREGNMHAFEQFWLDGGTEEGDAKLMEIRERMVLRYLVRQERTTK